MFPCQRLRLLVCPGPASSSEVTAAATRGKRTVEATHQRAERSLASRLFAAQNTPPHSLLFVLDQPKGKCLLVTSNTYVEAIMRHVRGDSDVTVPHGLVDVLVVFDQDSLGPHVLLRPSVKEVKQSQTQNKPGSVKPSWANTRAARIATHMCWRTLEQSEGSTFCQQPR